MLRAITTGATRSVAVPSGATQIGAMRVAVGTRGAEIAAPLDEAGLVARIASGDAAAFRQIAERHAPVLLAAARRLIGDEAEAEDIVQDGLLRLWRSAGALEVPPVGIRPWLRRVVRNLAIDRLRSGRRTEVTDEVPEVAEPAPQGAASDERELASRVEQALRTLPERQRMAIALFHFEEMSQRDVAERMGLSEDALESLLARGRRALKTALADEWRGLLESGP